MSYRPAEAPTCHERDTVIRRLIQGKEKDLGDIVVRRLLPNVQQRMVGPFVFVDHFGPATLPAGKGLDVRPHPHVHLATVTYLFEGEQMHRDSVGSVARLTPGALGWMNAGSGIVHSERSPDDLRAVDSPLHGLQCWVALPDDAEDSAPTFQHIPADALPERDEGGVRLRMIAGQWGETRSPVETHSSLFYAEATTADGGELHVPAALGERALYVVKGAATVATETVASGSMAVLADGVSVPVTLSAGAHVMLLGGAPIGRRVMFWNFVGSSQARLDDAKQRWREDRFPLIESDPEERIPLPE